MSTTTVKLTLTDVLGNALDDHSVVVDIFSLDNSRHFRVTVPLSGQTEVAIRLTDCASDVYRFMLTPTNYRLLQFFLRLAEGNTVVREEAAVFPVNPDRVMAISAPSFRALDVKLQAFLAKSGGKSQAQKFYDSLPPLRKAALLNLFSKSARTVLGDGLSCFDHLGTLNELLQDRLFATTNAALVEETLQDRFFRPVDPSLHKPKPPYHIISSFKTRDAHGNLQLTFARNGETGDDYMVDMDIDEAGGIEHAFEVIRNSVHGPTNPYNVREILAIEQEIRPLYGFQFAQRGEADLAAAVSG